MRSWSSSMAGEKPITPKADEIGFSHKYFFKVVRRCANDRFVEKLIVGITNPTTEAEIKEEIREYFERKYGIEKVDYYLSRRLCGPYASMEKAEGR